ncbi:MAG TPA: hypothetical protein VF125_09385 [Solirubrobacterales bacterium]
MRILVGVALSLALAASVFLPPPQELPAVALGQPGLYRLEVALSFFYGCLLIITPAFSGLAGGRLPTEISTRGAKFAEEAERSAEDDEVAATDLEHAAGELREELALAINQVNRKLGDDKR